MTSLAAWNPDISEWSRQVRSAVRVSRRLNCSVAFMVLVVVEGAPGMVQHVSVRHPGRKVSTTGQRQTC